jgi:hypothetical protein
VEGISGRSMMILTTYRLCEIYLRVLFLDAIDVGPDKSGALSVVDVYQRMEMLS